MHWQIYRITNLTSGQEGTFRHTNSGSGELANHFVLSPMLYPLSLFSYVRAFYPFRTNENDCVLFREWHEEWSSIDRVNLFAANLSWFIRRTRIEITFYPSIFPRRTGLFYNRGTDRDCLLQAVTFNFSKISRIQCRYVCWSFEKCQTTRLGCCVCAPRCVLQSKFKCPMPPASHLTFSRLQQRIVGISTLMSRHDRSVKNPS